MNQFNNEPIIDFSFKKRKSAVIILIIINVIMFLPWVFSYLTGNSLLYGIVMAFGALTINIDGTPAFFNGHLYQAITAMFLHGSLMHLIFNMYALYMFGQFLEAKLGRLGFVIFYLTIGISANIISAYFFRQTGYPVRLIGASGAIYGLLLAFGAFNPEAVVYLFFAIPIKIKWLVPGFIVVELLMEFTQTSSGIAHMTHLFGLLCAFIYMLIVMKVNPIKQMYFNSN